MPTQFSDRKPSAIAFTGRKRARTPKKSVLIADRVARYLIMLGGVGSIVAVSLVGLFLVYVVLPLFVSPSMPPEQQFAAPASAPDPPEIVHLALNEYLTMSWELLADGSLVVKRLDDGRVIARETVVNGLIPSCWSFASETDRCAFGYPDGTVRLGRIAVYTSLL